MQFYSPAIESPGRDIIVLTAYISDYNIYALTIALIAYAGINFVTIISKFTGLGKYNRKEKQDEKTVYTWISAECQHQ